MPQINESPTSTAVVAEALNRVQRIASEYAKDLITLASNLAITKIDLKMQATQSQKYDNVFVNLGVFHIKMVFFSAIRSYNAKVGGPHLLKQSRVLEKESLKEFITGKSYSRCQRIHHVLTAAMGILHSRKFDSRFKTESFSFINGKLKLIKKEKKLDLSVSQRKLLKS